MKSQKVAMEPSGEEPTKKTKREQGNKLELWNEAINNAKKSRLNPSYVAARKPYGI
jgi:hypothetical protein